MPPAKSGAAGLAFGLGAFAMWGGFPLFFATVAHISAPEVLAHRIVWSCLLLALLLTVFKRWGAVRAAVRDRRTLLLLCQSSLWVSLNWLVFIWAIAQGQAIQSSLGYYITPLISVAFGVVLLSERLAPTQWGAVALAVAGVGWMVAAVGAVPWISLALGVSFALYGLTRKRAGVDGLSGLFVETALLAPLALGYMIWLGWTDAGVFLTLDARSDLLLFVSGLLTTAPLVLFAEAARRMPLSALGLLQYLTPTGHLACAVFAFSEPFTVDHAVTFGLIWAGLALYSVHSLGIVRFRAGGQ
jgi:chloramphenicol-sensitive protein RarD